MPEKLKPGYSLFRCRPEGSSEWVYFSAYDWDGVAKVIEELENANLVITVTAVEYVIDFNSVYTLEELQKEGTPS